MKRIDEIHVHFSSSIKNFALYADTNNDGIYETQIALAVGNLLKDYGVVTSPFSTRGLKFDMPTPQVITVGKRTTTTYPNVVELEAYLRGDANGDGIAEAADDDGDGLTNAEELSTVYYQDMNAGDMPASIPDDGTSGSSNTASLAQFYGLPLRALANFTVDHPVNTELSASVGYWNGTAWTDYLVWDPGLQVREMRIVRPSEFAVYSGTIDVAAAVAHSSSTSKVEFRVNGVLKATVTHADGNEYRWTWNSTSLGDATPLLNATWYGTSGQKAWDQRAVKVNNLPPSVAWVSPANGTRAQDNVTVVAHATDFFGVDRVEFYVDDVLKGTVTAANAGPDNFSWVWDTASYANGWRVLKAVAWDTGGLRSVGVTRSLFKEVLGIRISVPSAMGYYAGTVGVVADVDEPNVTTSVEFRVDGAWKATATTPIGGSYLWNWTTANEDALRVVNVTQYDPIGPGAWAEVTAKVDNLPPAVSWYVYLNPVHGTATLRVRATDFYGIHNVTFYVDGQYLAEARTPVPGTNDFIAMWSTTNYCSNGLHTLTATAVENTDLAKSATASTSLRTDNDPLVCITNPIPHEVISGTVVVQTTTVSTKGIGRVEFVTDTLCPPSPVLPPRYTDLTPPYSWTWNTSAEPNGYRCLKATAYNAAGQTDTHIIPVFVLNNGCSVPPCGGTPAAKGSARAGSASPAQSQALAAPASDPLPVNALGVRVSEWASGVTVVGTASTVIANLTGSPADITQAERDAGLVRPGLSPSLFMTYLTWHLVVRDWTPPYLHCEPPPYGECWDVVNAGNVTAFTLRFEASSNPNNSDTDLDGLSDGYEVDTLRTLPVTRDSDIDGLSDDFEKDPQSLTLTIDGATAPRIVKTEPNIWDSDGDGLSDGEERSLGADRTVTDPTQRDTDNDGLWDGFTVGAQLGELSINTNATRTDSDGDTLSDLFEITPHDLVLTVDDHRFTRSVTTSPSTADSDGDGLKDNEERAGTTVYGVTTDPSDADTDDDGLADGQERYTKQVAMPTRKTVGTSLSVPLSVRIAGPVEKVTASYGLSTIDMSNFYLTITQGSNIVVLRNHAGSGLFNFSSMDLPSTMWGGGTYTLRVSSWASGGILEKYSLLFTIRTSPILKDTDDDGLNDTEETTAGSDGWITDPQLYDTDGDTWGDADEISTRGTNPLAADTDGDGAQDNVDLDPLHNLAVALTVNQVHHGGAWWDPELLGVVRVNDDYAWVTQHLLGSDDGTDDHTASFFMTYYSDVPDDVPTANLRVTGWSVNWWGDDLLVDFPFSYSLGTTYGTTAYNGNSWISYSVSTVGLGKATALLITDGEVTVTSTGGLTRMAGPDRFFVFTLDLPSAWYPFSVGVNTVLVPRSVFLDSQLKADFSAGSYYPLSDAPLYGDDIDKAEISDGVAGVVAKRLTAYEADYLLNRLLMNASGGWSHTYVDITGQALAANLPADVVKILAWEGVTNGPTGPVPATFWEKIGAIATRVVNTLVEFGQLIYKGLVALGTFLVNLAEAIADWGMKALGTVVDAAVTVAQKVGEALSTFVNWVIAFAGQVLQAAIQGLLTVVKPLLDATLGNIISLVRQAAVMAEVSISILTAIAGYILDLAQKIALIPIAIRAAEIGIAIVTAGVGFVALKAIGKLTGEFMVHALSLMAISLTAEYLIAETVDSVVWVEKSTIDYFKSVGVRVEAGAGAAKAALAAYKLFHASGAVPWWRFVAFGISVLSLMLALFVDGFGLTGNALLIADFLMIAFGLGGLLIYYTKSLNMVDQATDAISSLGATFEKVVVYCTIPIGFAKVIVHGRTPGYG